MPEDIPTILKCKNIDFGHVDWQRISHRNYFSDERLMIHLVDNVMDADVHDNNNRDYFTFVLKVCCYTKDRSMRECMLNNCGVTNSSYAKIDKHANDVRKYKWHNKYKQLVRYLTDVSLNRFTKYYNIIKYYDVIYLMLLIIKVQRKVPKIVVRHLIVPFIYQR